MRTLKIILISFLAILLSACMTTGYHYAKDPNMVKKWDVTVVSVKPQNIYNSVGVALVGPLASVEAKGWEVVFTPDGEKKQATIVQPSTDKYELRAGQRAIYIVSKGHVWVQPADYPLPPEFSESKAPASPQTNTQQQNSVKAPLNTAQNPPITAPSNPQDVTATNEINTTNTKGIAEPVMIAIPGRDYEISKFEVTRGQFAEFVNETNYDAGDKCTTNEGGKWGERSGRNWRNPGFAQDDNHPVVCVNWNDAQAYISWLSKRTGKQYRLPKEVEWEYACYGGSQTEYCGSNDINAVAWYEDNSSGHAHPTGQKQANGYGLYDMSGNVWKWMDDCWEGNCTKRMVRGGAWSGKPRGVRAAFRIGIDTPIRGSASGFRLARTTPVSSSPQSLKDAATVTDTTNKTHTTSTKSDMQPTNAAISQKLRELHALKKEGLITEKEFQEKKNKLLEQY